MSRTYRTKKRTNEKITDANSNKIGYRRCHCLLCETNRMHGTKKESEICNPIIVPKSAYESNGKND